MCCPIQLVPSHRQGPLGSATNLLLQWFTEPLYLHVKHYSVLALSSHRYNTPRPSRDRFVRSGLAKKLCRSDTLFLAGTRFFVWQKTRITGPETDLMGRRIPATRCCDCLDSGLSSDCSDLNTKKGWYILHVTVIFFNAAFHWLIQSVLIDQEEVQGQFFMV